MAATFEQSKYRLFRFNNSAYEQQLVDIRANNVPRVFKLPILGPVIRLVCSVARGLYHIATYPLVSAYRYFCPVEVQGKRYVLALDIEKISEVSFQGLSAIGYCVREFGAEGRIITAGSVALPFVQQCVTAYQMDDFFNKTWNTGLLDKWLAESAASYETYRKFITEVKGGINNSTNRDNVSKYLLENFACDIDQLQLDVKASGGSVEIVSDYPEFDIAEINHAIVPYRGKPLAFAASERNEDGTVSYSWSGAAINCDSLYRNFLPHTLPWGFGAALAKKWGLYVPANTGTHMATDDAIHIATEYCILAEAASRE